MIDARLWAWVYLIAAVALVILADAISSLASLLAVGTFFLGRRHHQQTLWLRIDRAVKADRGPSL